MLERNRVVSPILGDLYARLDDADDGAARARPFITLAYAQSLDGSIAGLGRRPLSLSGPSSLQLTHELRAAHDAILVGIGTVLSDDPQLNVRLVPARIRNRSSSTLVCGFPKRPISWRVGAEPGSR